MINRTAVVSFFFLIGTLAVFPEDNETYRWEGNIKCEILETPGKVSNSPWSGEALTTWNIDAKFIESERKNIVDKKGKLTGQFVNLKDCGCKWRAKKSGVLTEIVDLGGKVSPYSTVTRTYGGDGSGTGDVFQYALIYYSMSEDDPLKNVVPNGYYYFLSGGPGIQFLDTSMKEVEVYYDGRVRTDEKSFKAPLGYIIGCPLIMPFASLSSNAGNINAETIAPILANSKNAMAQAMMQWDTEARTLEGGRMKGSFSRQWHPGIKHSLSWDLQRKLNIDAVIYNVEKKWRPSLNYGSDFVSAKAEIKSEDTVGKFRFTLFDATSEKGVCLNAGEEVENDLEFAEGQSGFVFPDSNNRMVIETSETKNSAEVRIKCLDYGAWGKLKAEVNVEGEWTECSAEGGGSYITIPYDENENFLADSWEEEYGVSGEQAESDTDDKPEDIGTKREKGDGFSNYEEYRGFMVNGEWTDTDPKHKDLFIYDELGFGIGKFTDLQLVLHLIDKSEMDRDRVVNFNRGKATISSQSGQKGLYLCGETLAGSYGEVSVVGSPNVVDKVMINVENIADSFYYQYLNYGEGKSATDYGKFKSSLEEVIAHELGHAVNLMHHGLSEMSNDVELFQRAGTMSVAVPHGIWSGDVVCLMRYDPPDKYLAWNGEIYDYPSNEGGASRTVFCDQKEGTGINSSPNRIDADGKAYPVAGDAEFGDCRKNVTIKGSYTWGQ